MSSDLRESPWSPHALAGNCGTNQRGSPNYRVAVSHHVTLSHRVTLSLCHTMSHRAWPTNWAVSLYFNLPQSRTKGSYFSRSWKLFSICICKFDEQILRTTAPSLYTRWYLLSTIFAPLAPLGEDVANCGTRWHIFRIFASSIFAGIFSGYLPEYFHKICKQLGRACQRRADMTNRGTCIPSHGDMCKTPQSLKKKLRLQ